MDTPALATPHPVLPTVESKWPTVLGIIAIVFGLAGALLYGVGGIVLPLIAGLMTESFQAAAESEPALAPTIAQMESMSQNAPLIAFSSCLSGVVALILLAAGIGLLRRRPWARTCSLVWAGIRVVAVVPSTIIGYKVNTEQFQAMQEAAADSPGAMPSSFFGMMEGMTVIGVVFGVLWALAMPVFFIVWFMRRRIRDEMAAW